MPEHFPLFLPREARSLFASEELARRLPALVPLTDRSKILDLSAGITSLYLAKTYGCPVLAADTDEVYLGKFSQQAREKGVGALVETARVQYSALPFGDASFDLVLAIGRVPLPFAEAARSFRRLLAPSGRVVMTYPVRVGRVPDDSAAVVEARLGEKLRQPFELLQLLSAAGYDPETIETASDLDLDDYYRTAEGALSGAPQAVSAFRDEIAAHRKSAGKVHFSYALVIGRRKEPGEKPPASRGGA